MNARLAAVNLTDPMYNPLRNLKALVDLLQLASYTKEEIVHETLVRTTFLMQDQLLQIYELLQGKDDGHRTKDEP